MASSEQDHNQSNGVTRCIVPVAGFAAAALLAVWFGPSAFRVIDDLSMSFLLSWGGLVDSLGNSLRIGVSLLVMAGCSILYLQCRCMQEKKWGDAELADKGGMTKHLVLLTGSVLFSLSLLVFVGIEPDSGSLGFWGGLLGFYSCGFCMLREHKYSMQVRNQELGMEE